MKTFNISDVCFFDCETTGAPAKGLKWEENFNQFPHIVQIAWSLGDKERSFIVKPNGWIIPEDVVEIHGITTERALSEGIPFEIIIDEFLMDSASAKLICAHNIYFDTSLIKADILRVCGKDYYDAKADNALYKGKRIDTMMKTIKFVGALYSNGRPGKFPRLEELYAKLFEGETFMAHNALEDVKALRRCLPKLVELGIIELSQKEYPAEQLSFKDKSTKMGITNKIEFTDPNPIVEPKPEFDNANRNRYYGLRVGDIIEAKRISGVIYRRSKVLELVFMDNNAVLIEGENGNPIQWVAEWCDIITKVEDINKDSDVNVKIDPASKSLLDTNNEDF